jgi:hypothetical protein
MPKFEITAPDGARYEVEGPDEAGAVNFLRSQLEAPKPAPQRSQWENFKTGVQAVIQDPKLALGIGPAKIVQDAVKGAVSAATLPGDVYTGKEPIGQLPSQMTPEQGMRVAELAALGTPVNPAVRIGSGAIPTARQVVTPGETRFVSEAAPTVTTRELPAPGAPVIDQALREVTTPPTISYEPTLRTARPAAPTQEALFKSGDEQFNAMRAMGVEYKSDAIAATAAATKRALQEKSLLRQNAPATHGILDDLASPPPGSTAPLASIDIARQALGKIATEQVGKSEGKAAARALREIDSFVEKAGTPAGSSAVVAGPAAEAAGVLRSARGDWAAGSRSKRLTQAEQRAEHRAESTHSGLNLGNNLRQHAAYLLDPRYPKRLSGFSPEEVAAIRAVSQGNKTANLSRYVGNLMGKGGGLGASVASGLSTAVGVNAFGPAGWAGLLAGPLVGQIARKISDTSTRRALHRADEMVRARSPLHELAPDVVVGPSTLPARSLSLMGLEETREPLEITVRPSGWVR